MPLFYKYKIRKHFAFLEAYGYHELNGNYKSIYHNDPILCFSNNRRKVCFYYDYRENRFNVSIRNGAKIEDISGPFITLVDYLTVLGNHEAAKCVSDLSIYKFSEILKEAAFYLKKYKTELDL